MTVQEKLQAKGQNAGAVKPKGGPKEPFCLVCCQESFVKSVFIFGLGEGIKWEQSLDVLLQTTYQMDKIGSTHMGEQELL